MSVALFQNKNHTAKSACGNRFLFQGREYDYDTALYYFRARWYEPETGRWLSPDPIGISGGLNLYAFCGNDPVNFVDPDGLAIVRNRTHSPIIVKGGIGPGKGHTQYGTKEYYSVVMPGETAGGILHPLVVSDFNTAKKFASKGISMVQDLSLANSIFDLIPSFSLYDIDYYYDNGKWKKIKGNDWGFIYDIADKNGGLSDTIGYFSLNPLITVLREAYLDEHPINYKRYLHP